MTTWKIFAKLIFFAKYMWLLPPQNEKNAHNKSLGEIVLDKHNSLGIHVIPDSIDNIDLQAINYIHSQFSRQKHVNISSLGDMAVCLTFLVSQYLSLSKKTLYPLNQYYPFQINILRYLRWYTDFDLNG